MLHVITRARLALMCLAMVLPQDANASTRSTTPMDLSTTVPISPRAFWRLASSEDFYRDTRTPTTNVHQRVVGVGSWVSQKGEEVTPSEAACSPLEDSPEGSGPSRLAGVLASTAQRKLKRKVLLAYDLKSPFGTSEARVVQTIGLGAVGNKITYSEASCVSGFPMLREDLNTQTTWFVTPLENDPGSVRVTVVVDVDDIALPFGARWLNGTISRKLRKDLVKAAKDYLDAMAAAEATADRSMPNGSGLRCQASGVASV